MSGPQTRHPNGSVHRPGIEIFETELLRQAPGHGGFSGSQHAVNRHHSQCGHCSSAMSVGIVSSVVRSDSITSKNAGNVLATQPGSAMEIPG